MLITIRNRSSYGNTEITEQYSVVSIKKPVLDNNRPHRILLSSIKGAVIRSFFATLRENVLCCYIVSKKIKREKRNNTTEDTEGGSRRFVTF